ncbi:MAG TPA: c-type cytochrome biogenesis protein CcsB [Candidatus Dormibacteraeota bacterium]|jgi:cytochrome c-type biogenesis protein CcsB|nr:c-type cytochrome biogenesis protein CcsB [Candidatus Dormibacteraeota bacterium]
MEHNSQSLFAAAAVAYFVSMPLYFVGAGFGRVWITRVAMAVTAAGLAAHLGSYALRWAGDGHYPLSNMYEYTSQMVLVMVAFFLVSSLFWRTQYIGGLVMIGAVALMGVGQALYVRPEGLIPALNSYWLKIHVTSMVTSSALLSFTFFFSLAALLKAWAVGGHRLVLASGPRYAYAPAGPGAATVATGPRALQVLTAWLPEPETLDRLAFRMVLIGFPLWTFGVMMGAVWGEHAWGRWWGNDPKEIMAAVTWIVYAIYFHARAIGGWRGYRTTAIAALGFVSVLATFYFVNLWIVGLHSYAR